MTGDIMQALSFALTDFGAVKDCLHRSVIETEPRARALEASDALSRLDETIAALTRLRDPLTAHRNELTRGIEHSSAVTTPTTAQQPENVIPLKRGKRLHKDVSGAT